MVNIRKGYSFCEKHNISYLKFCKNCEQMDNDLYFKDKVKSLILKHRKKIKNIR